MIKKFLITLFVVSIFFTTYQLTKKQETPEPKLKQAWELTSNDIQVSIYGREWTDAKVVKSF